jgi:hypothetical protein
VSLHELHGGPGSVPKGIQKAVDHLVRVTSCISADYGPNASLAAFHDAAAVVDDLLTRAEAYDLDAARLAAEAKAFDHLAKDEFRAYSRIKGESAAKERIEEERVDADPRLMEALTPVRLSEVSRAAEVRYRVQGLILANANTLLWAQAKTGKTTWLVNYIKALTVPGTKLLEQYEVTPVAEGRTVGFLNYEMDAELFAVWADEHGVDDTLVQVWNLRGLPNPLKSRTARQRLVQKMKAANVEVLLIDTYARAMLSDNEMDNPAATDWFKMIGELTAEAGVTDVLVTHHAGWQGDRLRGASALQDFPDVLLGLTRDEKTGKRFLQAKGRMDNELEPTELVYEKETRTLALTGLTKAQMQTEATAQAVEAKQTADLLRLQQEAQALADVLGTEKVSQTRAFDQVEVQRGLTVHRSRRREVVAYAVKHHGIHVGGGGGPGAGGAKGLSRGAA